MRNNSLRLLRVVADRDPIPEYEYPPLFERLVHTPFAILLSAFPAKIAEAILLAGGNDHSDTHVVHRNVTGYIAMETMYTYLDRRAARQTSRNDDWWESFLYNTKDLRNRRCLVRKEVGRLMANCGFSPVRITSLGSGSARPVIEAIASFNGRVCSDLSLIDLSRDALNLGQTLAKKFGLQNVTTYRGFAQNISKYCANGKPHIVEMVGLLDYFADNEAILLIKEIFGTLAPGGHLITCNIVPNLEQGFVTKGIGWKMIYRRPRELGQLLIKAGFSPSNIHLILTPLKLHCVAICQKQPEEVA